jgi:signal transduction histidine kinase
VEAVGEDEVGLLARAVNSMADAIASRDRDIQARASELARLGRYLSSVLDSLDDALIVLEDGQVTLANPAAARWGVHGPGPLPDVLQAVTGTGRHVLQPGDGSHHAVRSVSFGDRGAVLITSDMTRDVRSRERLARSEQLAMVGQMLGQIAHEVRNPLNALSLNAELLSDELAALDPDGRTDAGPILAIISAEISRLDSLTGRYLELVRQPPPALQGVDVGALLRDVARLAAPTAAAAGCEVDVAVSELPPQLLDGNQLRQATLNVLKNAVQADARKVKLGLEVADAVLRVVVRDDGPGMDEEALHRATEPFFTTKVTGTGLGLSVTRQIVEDHEGSLRLASVPGEGTTVTIELPRRDAVEGLRGEEGA